MNSRWFSAIAVLALTLLSFFVFPGHTILQADTQIYIPILERLADPSLLANDIMAARPHVSYTIYDEAALTLRRITGLPFEQVLTGQQLVYRAVAIFGLYLFAAASGLSVPLSWLAAALVSLGAAIIGPAVLIVEFEPVPRGFALPFLILSLAMVARRQWNSAAGAATIALAFHPPTAFAWCAVLGLILIWQRAFRAIAVLAVGPLLLAATILGQAPPPEKAALFGAIDPALEELQRMRAAYNWVSMWAHRWMPLYVALWAAGMAAWWRVRDRFSRETNLFLVTMPALGMVSVPVSFLLLEKMKLVAVPQFQPARYLLYVTLFAMILAAIAGIRAAQRGSQLEAAAFLFVPIAVASMEWDAGNLLGLRSGVAFGMAALAAIAARRGQGWLVAAAAIAPIFALPYGAGVRNYAAVHTAEMDELAHWARGNTPSEAVFQFGDAERSVAPGVFRARAKRALHVDWKAGGQVNFMRPFAMAWAERWKALQRQQPLDEYRRRQIDFLVLRKTNPLQEMIPVFENAAWVVYDLRNASTSLRKGIDACAPTRVTDSAAAALAKRRASASGCSSESATARPALKVSPAAVVSLASTANPGA